MRICFSIVSGFEARTAPTPISSSAWNVTGACAGSARKASQRVVASVIKRRRAAVCRMPFITRLPGLPELPRGQQLELDVSATDLIDLTLEARVHRVLACRGRAAR